MEQNIKEQIDILVELQAIEVERLQINRILEKDPEKLKSLETEYEEQSASVEAEEKGLSELKKQYRACEADLQINGERIQKLQERLRTVKTNREYQTTLKEIGDMEAKNSAIEDRMIEYLDRIEALEKEVGEKKKDLMQFASDTEEEKAAVEKEIAENSARLEELEESRKETAAKLDPGLMKTYQRIRDRGLAVAIAPVVSAVCQGCNMNIPPQMFNELQRFDSLKLCPFCERILYWKEPADVDADSGPELKTKA